MRLSKAIINGIRQAETPRETNFNLHEKVLQFGTGVLLRGLPDYFIDKANRQGNFNGRIVVVKSTGANTEDFDRQDGLFTHRVCGIENGKQVSRTIVNGSISRVLSAQTHWNEILKCAADPEMQIVISNTTEVGIVLTDDNVRDRPPGSYPGKLLAFLFERYRAFAGDQDKGMVIIPTELITDNATKLKQILLQLARQNDLDNNFVNWLDNYNYFCNSLVDRIVPGKLAMSEKKSLENELGAEDDLAIISEPYCLWAIETGSVRIKDILSFYKSDEGVVIAPDITKFRELKLRLLNGTHTFCCGAAFLSGFTTVKQAMDDVPFAAYMQSLMLDEIIPSITTGDLSAEAAMEFTNKVLDRFRNPYIEHKWLNITLQYSSKMAMRNVPVIANYIKRFSRPPKNMARGFAAHILFMKCSREEDGKYYGLLDGVPYIVNDDNAAFYGEAWQKNEPARVVTTILAATAIWGTDLNSLNGLAEQITAYLIELNTDHERVSR